TPWQMEKTPQASSHGLSSVLYAQWSSLQEARGFTTCKAKSTNWPTASSASPCSIAKSQTSATAWSTSRPSSTASLSNAASTNRLTVQVSKKEFGHENRHSHRHQEPDNSDRRAGE